VKTALLLVSLIAIERATGERVVAWQWDGRDETSLRELMLDTPYEIDGDLVVFHVGEDGNRIVMRPGAYIVSGPQQGVFRTFTALDFDAAFAGER
jgi:hypothetical protein